MSDPTASPITTPPKFSSKKRHFSLHGMDRAIVADGGNLDIASEYLSIERKLCELLREVSYGPNVTHVYNPIEYASETHECFVRKYCTTMKEVLFLGMNPGPFGMAQNGVPFGDTRYVREWLRIEGTVGKPEHEHPKRIIMGLECSRREASARSTFIHAGTLVRM